MGSLKRALRVSPRMWRPLVSIRRCGHHCSLDLGVPVAEGFPAAGGPVCSPGQRPCLTETWAVCTPTPWLGIPVPVCELCQVLRWRPGQQPEVARVLLVPGTGREGPGHAGQLAASLLMERSWLTFGGQSAFPSAFTGLGKLCTHSSLLTLAPEASRALGQGRAA